MLSGRTVVVALAIAVAGYVSGPLKAVAEESGSFRMLVSLVHDYNTIDQAGTKITAGRAAGTVTLLASDGAEFPGNANQLARCVVHATVSQADSDLRAACTVTDRSGDSWFVMAKRSAGDIGEGESGDGRWEMTGGTGRYAGVSGSCSYTTEYLPENFVVSSGDCTWQK